MGCPDHREFVLLFKGHRQSPCTALNAGCRAHERRLCRRLSNPRWVMEFNFAVEFPCLVKSVSVLVSNFTLEIFYSIKSHVQNLCQVTNWRQWIIFVAVNWIVIHSDNCLRWVPEVPEVPSSQMITNKTFVKHDSGQDLFNTRKCNSYKYIRYYWNSFHEVVTFNTCYVLYHAVPCIWIYIIVSLYQRENTMPYIRFTHYWPLDFPSPAITKWLACGALMFGFMLASTSCWSNSRVDGDSIRHDAYVTSL